MSESEDIVECGKHGNSSATYVCKHLLEGEQLGFNYGYDPDEPDEIHPDAWCDECEKIRSAEGGWNDKSESFAEIKLLCSFCYENLREKNWIQDNEDYTDFLCSSVRYLEERQNTFMKKFRIGDYERWDWYQETGKLIFSHDGVPQVEADIDFSGSISTKSDTWLWAWANNSLSELIKSSSRSVRESGEKLGYMNLATARWSASEEDGWEMTAILAKTLNAIGAYRTPGETGYTYMVVRKAKWVNKKHFIPDNILNFFNRNNNN